MNNKTAHAQLAEVTAEVETLQQRRLDLQTQLADTSVQESAAQARASTLAAAVMKLEREPAAKAQLELLAPTLHARLAKAPPNSPTVQAVRKLLPRLADENEPAADRLDLVRDLLKDLGRRDLLDRQHWISVEGPTAIRQRGG